MRCGRDEDAVTKRRNAGRKVELFGKQRRAIVPTVAVVIVEKLHPSAGLSLAVDPERIVGHFDDPQPSVVSPGNVHRVGDERLSRNQFDLHPRPNGDRLQRVGGGNRFGKRIGRHRGRLGFDGKQRRRRHRLHQQSSETSQRPAVTNDTVQHASGPCHGNVVK